MKKILLSILVLCIGLSVWIYQDSENMSKYWEGLNLYYLDKYGNVQFDVGKLDGDDTYGFFTNGRVLHFVDDHYEIINQKGKVTHVIPGKLPDIDPNVDYPVNIIPYFRFGIADIPTKDGIKHYTKYGFQVPFSFPRHDIVIHHSGEEAIMFMNGEQPVLDTTYNSYPFPFALENYAAGWLSDNDTFTLGELINKKGHIIYRAMYIHPAGVDTFFVKDSETTPGKIINKNGDTIRGHI